MNPWLTALIGFMGGGVLLFLGDRLFTRFSERRALLRREDSGRKAGFKRCAMLVFSITLHNIPEGMAIGVAFGSLAYGLDGSTAAGAWMLALGIGLQNLPEGMAVSVPLRREGYSRAVLLLRPAQRGGGAHRRRAGRPAGAEGPHLPALPAGLCRRRYDLRGGGRAYPGKPNQRNKDWMAPLLHLVGFSVMMVMDVALG